MARAKNMIKYVIMRILAMIPMVITVIIVTFFLTRMMAVDPATNAVINVSDPVRRYELLEIERKRMGWYDPWYIQIGTYLKNIFTGNWGQSYVIQQGKPVLEVIGDILPKTIELVIFPIIIVPIIAVKLGVTSATNKDKSKDISIRSLSILGAGFPIFWIATLLQLFFGLSIKYFTYGKIDLEIMYSNTPGIINPVPEGGFDTGFRLLNGFIYNDQYFLWDTISHLFLPVACLTFASLAGIARQTRASMLEILDQDYIRTARAKGVKEDDVINKHALRNAILPTSNLIVANITGSLLGSFFLEVSFNYTGYGYWMILAIFQGDYLVISGLVMFSSFIIMGGTLTADVLYTIIDPRIVYR